MTTHSIASLNKNTIDLSTLGIDIDVFLLPKILFRPCHLLGIFDDGKEWLFQQVLISSVCNCCRGLESECKPSSTLLFLDVCIFLGLVHNFK